MTWRWPRLVAAVGVCVSLLATGAPAHASPDPVWNITEVTQAAYPGPTGYVTFQPQCPAGQLPISGGYTAEETDVRVVAQQFQYQSGGRYILSLADLSPGYPQIIARVWCVPTGYFSDAGQVAQSFTVGSDNIAAGTVGCPAGQKALHASVTFGGTDSTLLTSYPNAGLSSWYVKGWNASVGSSMVVWVRCVSGADFGALRTYNSATAIGWGTTTTASCPSGMRPITGGTFHSGGDGGAITVQSRGITSQGSYAHHNGQAFWTEGGWRSIGLSTSGGSMVTNVMCVPATTPHFNLLSAAAAPNPNSASARWEWQTVDPAGAGGYGLHQWCYYAAPNTPAVLHDPCSSPFQVNGLADGSYNLTVHAQTGDGRYNSTGFSSIVIDTTGPGVNATEDLYGTADPALAFAVTDATNVETLTCGADSATPQPCGEGYNPGGCADFDFCWDEFYDYRGSQSTAQAGLSDGSHELHVAATDERGNAATHDLAFTVDTRPPTVTQTAPSSRFTVSTSVPVAWTGQDATTDVSSFAVRRRQAPYNGGFGAWSAPLMVSGSATSRTFRQLPRGNTHCFSVRATDEAGHSSAWRMKCTAIPLDDRDLTTSNGWSTISPSGYFRGTALVSTTRGATLSVRGASLQRLAVVAQKCSTCGVVGVYVAGDRVGTIDLDAKVRARKVFALPRFSLRTGKVTLKVLSSGKTVRIDALGISRT